MMESYHLSYTIRLYHIYMDAEVKEYINQKGTKEITIANW